MLQYGQKVQTRYMEQWGGVCPECRSEDTDRGRQMEDLGTEVSIPIRCNKCGATWLEVYVAAYIVRLDNT